MFGKSSGDTPDFLEYNVIFLEEMYPQLNKVLNVFLWDVL